MITGKHLRLNHQGYERERECSEKTNVDDEASMCPGVDSRCGYGLD